MTRNVIPTWLLAIGLFCAPAVAVEQAKLTQALQTLQRAQAKLARAKASVTVQNPEEQTGIPEGEALFLSVYAEREYLGEVFALKSAREAQVELQSLIAVLDFAIDETEDNVLSGWYLKPEQSFSLDAKRLQVKLNERELRVAPELISREGEDIYVEAEQLTEWFGIDLQFNYTDQQLYVRSEQPLPAIQRLNRAKRKAANQWANRASRLPWKPNDYQALSSPLLDMQFGYRRKLNRNEPFVTPASDPATETEDSLYYSMLGAQDLAYWNVEYFISGREGKLLDQGRLKVAKEDPEGELLGKVAATQLEVGDIVASKIGAGLNSNQGLGLRVSDTPLQSTSLDNTVQISGPIQAGWDVELYHNNLMIAQQLQIQTGRFDFAGIPLYFGGNRFELVKYGPQGQVERETRNYYVEGTGIESGSGYFDVSITDMGNSLLDNEDFTSDQKGWQLNGRYDQGISDNLSFYGGFAHAFSGSASIKNTLATGARLSLWKKLLLNLDLHRDNEAQQQAQFSARSELAGQAISASWLNKRSLITSGIRRGELSDTQTLQLTMSGAVRGDMGALNYQNRVQWRESDRGHEQTVVTSQVSSAILGVNVSNALQWQNDSAEADHLLNGQMRFQSRFGRVFGRLIFDYQLHPERELLAYETRLYRSFSEQFNVELGFRDTVDTDYHKGELGLNWLGDKMRVSSLLSYDSEDEWQLGLNGQFSFGYHPHTDQVLLSRRRLASNGAVLIKVYLDNNNNGIFDADDEVMPDVRVRALQNYLQGTTDEQGLLLLSGMPLNQKTDMVIDIDSVDTPFVAPATEGLAITPRRGYVEYLELPMVNTSEIEGMVFKRDSKENTPLPYAEVTLIDEQGQVAASAQSAYDGYYVITGIKPGRYQAQVANAAKRGLTHAEVTQVALSQHGDMLLEVDLQLKARESVDVTVLSAGRFTSLAVLKTYALLLRKRHPNLIPEPPFYLFDEKAETYVLGIAFTQNADDTTQLTQRCETLKTAGVMCQLEQTELKR
ncbi:carboxypeptidase-like regulatory domain-containing protein [Pseudoalteromonas viridis]|uniref:Carboxypeptidase regulatory-like domain-containing protein n=1 Tax=Pseudoalteromonas viridis TaxID=339617 RepID=A0ABX7V5J6_9GAMM|nr:carboxypeptidase-like regulatory domain-containing protein [Pseudoalteromonas viridis]QTL33978.1 carboxypeptidase regulatory-like domain-containing protein [Pseudoalteromonas viridis]